MTDIKFTKSGQTKLIRATSKKVIDRLKRDGWLEDEATPVKKPTAKEKFHGEE